MFCVGFLYAQQPVTIQLTEKDGLPDIEFYDVLEDHNGFIWLAADKGLYRYDGKTFVDFTRPEKRGLSVFGLLEDEKGRIWCNNISGQFFYVKKGQLHLFTDLKDELKGQLPEFVIRDGNLVVFCEKGVFTIDIATKKKVLSKDKSFSSPFYGFPFHYKNQLYFTLSHHIRKFNKTNRIEPVFQFHPKPIEPKNNAFCALDNALFFSSFIDGNQHFFIQPNGTTVFRSIVVPEALRTKTIVRVIMKDQLLWFCTNQGVVVCSWNGSEISYKNTYLSSEYVTKMVKDRDNNFWFTTLRNGVFVMPNIHIKKIPLSETSQQVTTMEMIDSHTIAFGTTNGKIGLLDTETFKTSHFSLSSESKVAQLVYNAQYKAIFISQESQSYLWSLVQKKMYKLPYFTASKEMTVSRNHSLLNASYDRASLVDNPFEQVKKGVGKISYEPPVSNSFTPAFSIKELRMKRAYTCFYSSKTNQNYVGFVDELMAFDAKGQYRNIRYNHKPIFAIDIDETVDGTLWVSTFKDGVLGIQNGKVVYSYTTANGLLSNQTGKLKSDNNKLWISTEDGIQVLDTNSKKLQSLTKNDGLESYTVSDIAIVGDQVFLSSNKGIFVVDKHKSFKATRSPEVYFTGVSIQEKDTVLQSNYQLNYDKNAIKISFNVNGFQTKESVVYQYRLVGLNKEWQSLEKGTDFIRYLSLPPGDFEFQVKAISVSGKTSEAISMRLIILRPFWQKWWFYVLLSLALVASVWLYFRKRILRIEREKQVVLEKAETDRELVFSQLENLRSQMNPHFIFNALNSIQEYIVTNEKQTASAFLVKFSRLIRIYLEHSRESEVPLEEEVKALGLYLELEKDRFEDALSYEITVDEKLDTFSVKVPSLFIQPYVENALKHGLLHKKSNRKLSISFRSDSKKEGLVCVVEDNGIGREASAALNSKRAYLHQSFATTANQKRIELINKTRIKKAAVTVEDLYDTEHHSQGTRVEIFIPFG